MEMFSFANIIIAIILVIVSILLVDVKTMAFCRCDDFAE